MVARAYHAQLIPELLAQSVISSVNFVPRIQTLKEGDKLLGAHTEIKVSH
jgi:hypothetical protein